MEPSRRYHFFNYKREVGVPTKNVQICCEGFCTTTTNQDASNKSWQTIEELVHHMVLLQSGNINLTSNPSLSFLSISHDMMSNYIMCKSVCI